MNTIIDAVKNRQNVVVKAPTGSGKTTQVPQEILRSNAADDGIILVVQPRRISCRAMARRVSEECGVELGNEVGYIVRYEGERSALTKLCFVTDGVLMRMLESEAAFNQVNVVIFDEFHERRLQSDVALGLLKSFQQRRPTLRLVAMSATGETKPVANYLSATTVVSSGREYPVQIEYSKKPIEANDLPRVIGEAVKRTLSEGRPGNILVFLPGKAEIRKTERCLRKARMGNTIVLPLHSELGSKDQDRIFATTTERKVILATNIAETSLTVPGVTTVIDSGFERRSSYRHDVGFAALDLTRISRSSADQRSGRAGREMPGFCLRLWTETEQRQLEETTPPEIRRSDLCWMVLTLKSMGIKNVSTFESLERPDAKHVAAAEKLLTMLGAIDDKGELTVTGWRMLRLPLHPRLARMVIESEQCQAVSDMVTLTALMSGRSVFRADAKLAKRRFQGDKASDCFTLLQVYREADQQRFSEDWCDEHGVDRDALVEASRLRWKTVKVLRSRKVQWNNSPPERANVIRSIAAGLVDRVALKLDGRRFQLATGELAKLDPESVVKGDLIVAGEVVEIGYADADEAVVRMSNATVVTPELMKMLAPRLFSKEEIGREVFVRTGTAKVKIRRKYLQLTLQDEERFDDSRNFGRPLGKRLARLSNVVSRLAGKTAN